MPIDCLRKAGRALLCSMNCPTTSKSRSSLTRSRVAASVGEFLPLGHLDRVVMFSVLSIFTYLNLFDFLRMFILLGIFNLLGFVLERNNVPYHKRFLVRREFDIVSNSFIVRGL